MINNQPMIKFFKKIRQRLLGEPNILIFGQGKSGTTALYFKIVKAISNDYHYLFEPNEEKIIEINKIKKPIIVKNLNIEFNNYFKNFNKKIFITRDPRDRLVSFLLYAAGFHKIPETRKNYEDILKSIKLLKDKETNPDSISLLILIKEFFYLKDEAGVKNFVERWFLEADIHDFEKNTQDFFMIKYEDFVKNNEKELEKYLGFKLTKEITIDKSLNRVVRTKSSGSWRNWFLKEDIIFFKPIFKKYMDKFNYDFDDWKLNYPQNIQPKHSSEYVIRLINERRKSMGLKSIEEGNPK